MASFLPLALIVWFALPLSGAHIARSKGRSAIGYYVFGLLGIAPALIVALLVQPTRKERRRRISYARPVRYS